MKNSNFPLLFRLQQSRSELVIVWTRGICTPFGGKTDFAPKATRAEEETAGELPDRETGGARVLASLSCDGELGWKGDVPGN